MKGITKQTPIATTHHFALYYLDTPFDYNNKLKDMARKIHTALLMFSLLILGLWGLMPGQALAKFKDIPTTANEIINLLKTRGCFEINDFYKEREGIKPPYLFNFSENGISFAIACESKNEQKNKFFLIIFTENLENENWTCPSKVELNHFPGGLIIFPPEGLPIFAENKWNLKDFRYLDHPEKTGPDSLLEHDGILESYETGTIYYCHKGNWLFYSYD